MKWTKQIEAHYTRNWGVQPEACPFQLGRVHELPSGFVVLAFPPHEGRSTWTYATCGMSLPGDPQPVELHVFSPIRSEDLVELLYAVAHFHRTGTKLNLGHTVNFGRPWLSQSACSFGLISLPYLDGPELENFEGSNGSAKCYWLIPITKTELDLKKRQGLEALEARFESAGFDYSDPMRTAVV
jgi:hypothetical protein